MASSLPLPHDHVTIGLQLTHLLALPGDNVLLQIRSEAVKPVRQSREKNGFLISTPGSGDGNTAFRDKHLVHLLDGEILLREFFVPFLQVPDALCERIDANASPFRV